MKNIKLAVAALIHDESGQDLIEYALVAGLIGLGAVVAMSGSHQDRHRLQLHRQQHHQRHLVD